eukprot:PhF_6_TR9700/c0_g2_i2/m.14927
MTRSLKEKRDQRMERVSRLIDRTKIRIKAAELIKVPDYVFQLPDSRLLEGLRHEGVLEARTTPEEETKKKKGEEEKGDVESSSPPKKKRGGGGSEKKDSKAEEAKPARPVKLCEVEGCSNPTSNPAFKKCSECHQGITPNLRAPRQEDWVHHAAVFSGNKQNGVERN